MILCRYSGLPHAAVQAACKSLGLSAKGSTAALVKKLVLHHRREARAAATKLDAAVQVRGIMIFAQHSVASSAQCPTRITVHSARQRASHQPRATHAPDGLHR
jgi:hypothetical protein